VGGQNHQPTNRIRLIAPSAWLSRCVGDGFSHVLRANSELENAIIVGMDRLHVNALAPDLPDSALAYLGRSIEHLRASLAMLPEIEAGYDNLLDAARAENYQGNPLASDLPRFDLAASFEGGLVTPAINRAAWDELEARIADQNILGTLAWEATCFTALAEPTISLIEVIEECRLIAGRDGARAMVEAIELNELPLRQRFAPVFSRWNHLHAMFLYSALIMTELFYRTNAYGTLLSEEGPVQTATA
jgi:hypothetical protein